MPKRRAKSPSRPTHQTSELSFPVVGVGGSAGGLGAVSSLLESLPAKPGMAFVVVLHLLPSHESQAAQILQQVTGMRVMQVTQEIPVEADHVYVIAPGMHLRMEDGMLRVAPRVPSKGGPIAVDLFFRTLAQAHGDRAVAVVLSGGGSDGAVGVGDIKVEGGVVIAQAPSDAEHEAMPLAAIGTGLVDFVLPILLKNSLRLRG